jgi:hypothetical protein
LLAGAMESAVRHECVAVHGVKSCQRVAGNTLYGDGNVFAA